MQEQENTGRDSKGRFAKGNNIAPIPRMMHELAAERVSCTKIFMERAIKRFGSKEAAADALIEGFLETKKYDMLAKFLLLDPARLDRSTTVEEVAQGLNFDTPEKYEQALQILEKTQRELNELSKS